MSQQHIIRKQILELTLPCQETAFDMQNQVSALVRNRVAPMLDALFGELCDPDTVYRFDSLELDLGRIPISALQEELGKRIVEQLRTQVADAPVGQQTDTPVVRGVAQKEEGDRQGELVLYFLQTGMLPWWADSLDRNILNINWQKLLLHSPEKAQQIIRWCIATDRALDRFVRQFGDELLIETAAVHSGSGEDAQRIAALYPEIVFLCQEGSVLHQGDDALIRQQMWRLFFIEIGRRHGSVDEKTILRDLVTFLAQQRGGQPDTLLSDLASTAKKCAGEGSASAVGLPALLEQIAAESPGQQPDTIRAEILRRDLVGSLGDTARLREIVLGESDERLLDVVRICFSGNVGAIKGRIRDLLAALQVTPALANFSYEKTVRPDFWRIFLTNLMNREDHTSLFEDVLREFAGSFPNHSTDLLLELEKELEHSAVEESEVEHLMDGEFCDCDEVSVHNAGLVLLWPFLPRLFAALDIIREGKFVDESARERALFLMQNLVENESGAPEYQLPLSKVLCGLDLQAPVAVDWQLSGGEKEECEAMLDAVIQHWSALKNISRDGFRKAFLKRQGVLSVRDGGWLLRVERMGHDVLLDKLPWSIAVVKFPWLDEVLAVEW